MNMGVLQCDDGNKRKGDGCNELCEIEEGYKCQGGSKDSPDTCVINVGPRFEIKKITKNNRQIHLKFNMRVQTKMKKFEQSDLVFVIKGSKVNVDFLASIEDTYFLYRDETIVISFEQKF